MPELPEVELAARTFRHRAEGRRLRSVEILDARLIRGGTEDAFRGSLEGRRVDAVTRFGKHLVVSLGEGERWWLHLGMTGKLAWRAPTDESPRFTRLIFRFDESAMHFVDPRLLGATAAGEEAALRALAGIDRLGPDALDVREGATLRRLVGRSRSPIKTALMDQKRLAGLGNIQACEALFRGGVDPWTPANALSEDTYESLAAGIVATLHHTLEAEGEREITYLNESKGAPNPFLVYGREAEACPNCSAPLLREKQAGRGTFFCARCQNVNGRD